MNSTVMWYLFTDQTCVRSGRHQLYHWDGPVYILYFYASCIHDWRILWWNNEGLVMCLWLFAVLVRCVKCLLLHPSCRERCWASETLIVWLSDIKTHTMHCCYSAVLLQTYMLFLSKLVLSLSGTVNNTKIILITMYPSPKVLCTLKTIFNALQWRCFTV